MVAYGFPRTYVYAYEDDVSADYALYVGDGDGGTRGSRRFACVHCVHNI